jgi:hypothetical protein
MAATAFWKFNSFDPVKGALFDPDLEKRFKKRQAQEALTHGKKQIDRLPHSYRYSESALYQPINGVSVDDKRLKEFDAMKKAAKKRYEVRRNTDDNYHIYDIQIQEREKQQAANR